MPTNRVMGAKNNSLSDWHLLSLLVLFSCLWLWHHPYWGIMHDAVLYAGQALKHLYPETYSRDVFFLYGSQDDYTLFSPIYARLIELVGLGQAAMLITLAGMLAWCYAAWRLACNWPGASRWLFLFLLAVMPLKFAGNELLAAAEAFAVPRLWADALALLACALWIERRFAWALLAWALAMLMHPLMALAGITFIFFYEARPGWRWAAAFFAGVLVASLLALAGAPLFGRLFQPMDPEWFELVYERTSLYMFPTAWGVREYNVMIFHATALLWAASLMDDARLRKILLAACATGLAGWLVAIVGGDWLHSVLVLQVQPWRTLWLMYVVGWGAVAWLVLKLWGPARFAVLGLAAAWFLREYSGGLLLLLVLVLYWQRHRLGANLVRLLEGGLALAIVLYLVWTAMDASTAYLAVYPEDRRTLWEAMLGWRDKLNHDDSVLTLAAAIFAYWVWRQGARPLLGVLLVLVAFLAYGRFWDLRSEETKTLESGELLGNTPFNKLIPPTATVYWLEGLQATWLLLGRASYFSHHQSAGLLFSRELTMELYRRHLQVKPLGGQASEFRLRKRKEAFAAMFDKSKYIEPATLPALRSACSDPKLDFVILPKRYEPWAMAAWFTPYASSGFGDGVSNGIYLYSCATLRKH